MPSKNSNGNKIYAHSAPTFVRHTPRSGRLPTQVTVLGMSLVTRLIRWQPTSVAQWRFAGRPPMALHVHPVVQPRAVQRRPAPENVESVCVSRRGRLRAILPFGVLRYHRGM